MPTAILNGTIVAQTSAPEVVEGNQYFPPGDIVGKYFKPAASGLTTVCSWKGIAHYYDVTGEDGKTEKDAAWYYPEPKPAAANIKSYVAFYKNKFEIKA